MTADKVIWLHSGGSFNKEPDNDLGNYPSEFKIGGAPNVMNNLFDDVVPEESIAGLVDYRCFYIWNSNVTSAIININLELNQCVDCGSDIEYGSKFIDDVQIVTINCSGFEDQPDDGGYVIFDTEFGAPFTVYWHEWCQFGSDLQSRLNEQPWCSSVTVTGCNPYTVTFTGEAGNRKVQLIRVVQNNLLSKGVGRFNTVTYFSCDEWNGYADFLVQTVQIITDYVPKSGTLRIYNPLTGLWDAYTYNNHDDHTFYLNNPLQFNLVGFLGSCPPTGDVDDPENWQRWKASPVTDSKLPVPWGVVEAPLQDKTCLVSIDKDIVGNPINNIAVPIVKDIILPEVTIFTTVPLYIGNLRPNEGFYMWIKRTTAPGTSPCLRDSFDIRLVATEVSWPLA